GGVARLFARSHDFLERVQCGFVQLPAHRPESFRPSQGTDDSHDNQKLQKNSHSRWKSYDRAMQSSIAQSFVASFWCSVSRFEISSAYSRALLPEGEGGAPKDSGPD